MRLLHLDSDNLSLTEDYTENVPPYAILSHTWGKDTEEVTFDDFRAGTYTDKIGYRKIYFCGEQAAKDGFQYFWIDTCCINKSNLLELSEAINSMFRWYRDAAKCYVYLSDVSTSDHDQAGPSLRSWRSDFRKSRWFSRGWTLQELIAPLSVEFFCSNGERLGDRKSLEGLLHEITGIAVPAFRGTDLSAFTVTERLSWAESRQTKKAEDEVYSLLGLFDVSMSLIYGEGREKARDRLLDKVRQHGKKRHRDELSHAPFEPTKRLKASCDQFSSISSTKQSLIEQLHFDKIDERLTGLTAAQQGTCRWFLTKPEYISWLEDIAQQADHSGFFWIKGNPGTGKSTLMKFLFQEAKNNAKNDSSHITLSFFFLARGTVEEKSTTGLYRSLLHQLFEKVGELKDSLEWMTADGARVIQRNGWREEALKQTLMHAVQKLGSRSLMIFVDALDECDKNQAAGMICFFEELCDCAREEQVRLQICFSSRHYPTIVIQKGTEVTLEDETGHTEDIKQYIKSKLRQGKLTQAESLRSEIFEKSSGIFLWVVLVIDILNYEYRQGTASTKIRDRLKEIPPGLTELFEMILTRYGENLERLHVCLKWILFASRPLKPQELYFAVELGLDKECSGFWDQEDLDLEQIKTFVRSSSKGLAEVTRNKASEVQFIHETVRDFLLGKYEGQWSTVSDLVGHGHEILRNCCLAQLNASIKDVDIPHPLPKASEAKQLRETINLKFPFLEYSVLNVLHHANGAQQNAIEQGHFLADFPLQRWVFLNNTLEQYGKRRYTDSVSLLYILAEKNLADLIRIHPQRESCFNVENERYGLPIFAALATGSCEAVQMFLEVQAEIRPQEPLLRHLCKQYSEIRNKRTNFGRDFTFSRYRNISSHVAEQGDEVILAVLCALGKLDVESKDRCYRTPLSWAAEKGHEAVAMLLLEKGAGLEAEDKGWSNSTVMGSGGRK
ncbi:heterokaryon incompatibility protein-domain-containing protein [Amylocarpus encephaloides]|uniref:Heterokaryon incompatibility protein-domain-containing protein n=1 Tax=Amylocarpus encephaloides TaxID=45428 RepID=A0A9P7YAF4_9HELO|nr:heterokaryon incompatibility protein-domain-containing protein [Amylocarpus encephaloides]